MKRLYARLVLWLIRPALDEAGMSDGLSTPRYVADRAPNRRARVEFFSRGLESVGGWTPCSSRADRRKRPLILRRERG